MKNGIVFDIKECTVHDGPGVRTTVFLKGCPLRCEWCHNPEGLKKQPELMVRVGRCRKCGLCSAGCSHEECKPFGRCLHICPDGCVSVCGKEYTSEELCKIILKNKAFFDASGGGVTFSGGEPLLQWEFLEECLDGLTDIHTAIETCGYADSEIFSKVIEKLDYVIMDIKLADNKLHKKYTGVSNDVILKNAEILKNSGKPHCFRTPLIPGKTDTAENLEAISKIVSGSLWEKIPCNEAAGAKYEMLVK